MHQRRKAETLRSVQNALAVLAEKGERVTFSAVAELAGVSRPTLYNHQEIREAVEEGRAAQKNARLVYQNVLGNLKAENRQLRKKVLAQKRWIEVLNDNGPVLRDEDLV